MRSYTSTYRVEIHYPLNGWVVVVLGGNPARGLGPRQANRIAEDQRQSETHYAYLNCPARRVRIIHEQTGAALDAAPTTRSKPLNYCKASCGHDVPAVGAPGSRARIATEISPCKACRIAAENDPTQPEPDPDEQAEERLVAGPDFDGTLFPGSQVCRRIGGPTRTSSNTPRLF